MKNKYQEALDWLMEGNDSCGTEWDLLQELVDKETPMKPITLEPCHYECGKCHSTILPIGQKRTWHKQFNKYCPNCGQKIDWSDEE